MDQFGNIYIVNNNTMVKYSNDFTNKTNYTNNFLGKISLIDVNDPLRVLIFYRDFNQIIFLDTPGGQVLRNNLPVRVHPFLLRFP